MIWGVLGHTEPAHGPLVHVGKVRKLLLAAGRRRPRTKRRSCLGLRRLRGRL